MSRKRETENPNLEPCCYKAIWTENLLTMQIDHRLLESCYKEVKSGSPAGFPVCIQHGQ